MNTPVLFRVANIIMSFRQWKYWHLQSSGWVGSDVSLIFKCTSTSIINDCNSSQNSPWITPNRTSITDAVDQILKYGKGFWIIYSPQSNSNTRKTLASSSSQPDTKGQAQSNGKEKCSVHPMKKPSQSRQLSQKENRSEKSEENRGERKK